MNRILHMVIHSCEECPFIRFRESNSSCNDDLICSKCARINNKHPKIPEWCPLEKEDKKD